MVFPPPAPAQLSQLLAADTGITLLWLGNDGWLLRAQGRLIAFDLDLLDTPQRLHKSPLSAEELAPVLDAVFISHLHSDHFEPGTAAILAQKSRCTFVLPANCVDEARRFGIPDDRIVVAKPRQPFDLLDIHVEPQHAFHGYRHQSVHKDANLDDCGYLLTLAGHRLLQPGDSVLTQDHLALKDIDVLFVSPTDHNMAVAPAALFIKTLNPRWIFPQHYATYHTTPVNDFWTVGHPVELRAVLSSDLARNFHQLRQGELFTIPAKQPPPGAGALTAPTPASETPAAGSGLSETPHASR